jgi:hypothetical protein
MHAILVLRYVFSADADLLTVGADFLPTPSELIGLYLPQVISIQAKPDIFLLASAGMSNRHTCQQFSTSALVAEPVNN